MIAAKSLKRKKDAHKGDFGHVLVLAGSRRFTGAPYLCAQAALLSGAGLVTVGVPQGLYEIIARKLTEAMVLPLPQTAHGSMSSAAYAKIKTFLSHIRITVAAIGPGLSQDPGTQKLVRNIIGELELPMVIDADGLNALRGNLDLLRRGSSVRVITPHPGEMSRLAGRRIADTQKDRRELAKNFSRRYNVITVLKGHGTVVASPDGSVYVNKTGNPGMAKGGSGDVLTGMIAALLAQKLEPFAAAKLAVYAHGLAADIAAKKKGELSLLAADILRVLPRVWKKLVR